MPFQFDKSNLVDYDNNFNTFSPEEIEEYYYQTYTLGILPKK